jgi:hypothetical protein
MDLAKQDSSMPEEGSEPDEFADQKRRLVLLPRQHAGRAEETFAHTEDEKDG